MIVYRQVELKIMLILGFGFCSNLNIRFHDLSIETISYLPVLWYLLWHRNRSWAK